MPRPGGVRTKTECYYTRKAEENISFISRVKTFIGPIQDVYAIILDDVGPDGNPNSLKHWIQHGGKAEKVWVPNPDEKIVKAVTCMGGLGRLVTLDELLQSGGPTNVSAMYLDFCGQWSTQGDAVRFAIEVRKYDEVGEVKENEDKPPKHFFVVVRTTKRS